MAQFGPIHFAHGKLEPVPASPECSKADGENTGNFIGVAIK
jgi:hypothetical protein